MRPSTSFTRKKYRRAGHDAEAAKSFPKLESLQVFQTELTDAALLELASIPTLKKLTVKSSVVIDWKPKVTCTDAGISAFAKLRPDVEIVN